MQNVFFLNLIIDLIVFIIIILAIIHVESDKWQDCKPGAILIILILYYTNYIIMSQRSEHHSNVFGTEYK